MSSLRKVQRWSLLCLLNLMAVAILGALLRFKSVWSLPAINYRYLLNAHSHFAFNGWITTALFTAFMYMLTREGRPLRRVYTYQFWFNQVSSFGMLLSFSLQGYGAVAIFFSSLSIVFYCWFAYSFGKELRLLPLSMIEKICIRAALCFLIASGTGPLLLGYSMAHAIGDLNFYMNAIYLFLHFQYNGWFTFSALALVFFFLRRRGVALPETSAKWFVYLMVTACIPAYTLSLLWMDPPAWIWIIGGAAGALQLAALAIFIRLIAARKVLPPHPAVRALFMMALAAFGCKIILQALSAIPFFGYMAFGSRPVIIAYLHLVMLCFVSFLIVGFFISEGLYMTDTWLQKAGIASWIAGVLLNEGMLTLQGLLGLAGQVWISGNMSLFAAALIILTGILLFVAGQLRWGVFRAQGHSL